jgi:hypothetical protein
MLIYQSAHFFLSEWIWSVTWDVYHVPFNIIITLILLKFFLRINMVRAVCLAIFSQLFAFLVLSICAMGAMYIIGIGGGPDSFMVVPKPLYATVFLGLLYALLQTIFFMCIYFRHKIPLSYLAVIVLISNNLTVLVTLLLFSIN